MLCPKCGHDQSPTDEDGHPRTECEKCGVVFAKITLECPRCKHVSKGLEIAKPNNCPECGVDVNVFLASQKPKQVGKPAEQPTQKDSLIHVKATCDNCGKVVAGIVSSLKKVNGKYLCPSCATNPDDVPQYFCPSCNQYFPNVGKKGNGWIEFALYLLYIFPGIIYSIWRRSGFTNACPKCKSSSIISASAGTHIKCPDCRELVLKDAKKCKHCGSVLSPQ